MPADARDVLVVVRAGARDECGGAAEDFRNRSSRERAISGESVRSPHRMDHHHVARARSPPPAPSRSDSISFFAASNPSSRRNLRSKIAEQRSATHGVWDVLTGLASARIEFTLRVALPRPLEARPGPAWSLAASAGRELGPDGFEEAAHALDGADAEKRHAAVGHAPVRFTSNQ